MNPLIRNTCDLANEAIKLRDSDIDKFERTIKEIIIIDNASITKSDLVNGLAGDVGYSGNEWWIEEFIMHDLKYCDFPEEIVNLLVFLLMTGGEKAEALYKMAVVNKLERFNGFLFYEFAHYLVHNANLPEKLVPEVVKVNDFARKSFSTGKPEFAPNSMFDFDYETNLIIINPNNHETIKRDDASGHVFEEDDENETDETIKLHYGDYWEEEMIYRSCLDEKGQPVLDRLIMVADVSSKARHKMLIMENRPIETWFNQNKF